MKVKWGIVLLLLCMLAALIWFRQARAHPVAEARYADEQIRMEIQAVQAIARPMKETAFQVVLTQWPEAPISDADLALNITMPDMFCGVFAAEIVESEPGVYNAIAMPVMKGQWQAEAILRWEDRHITVRTLFTVR